MQSEIMFYCSAGIFDRISNDIPPQMKILNTVIPLLESLLLLVLEVQMLSALEDLSKKSKLTLTL